MTPPESPEQLGPYELRRRVARQPAWTVYEALDAEHGRPVAVRLFSTLLPSPDQQRLAALAAASNGHPNIIAVRGCGDDGAHSYVATDWIEGESLVEYLARVGRLPAWQGLALVAQLMSALDFAHGRGWVHGAIEPRWLVVNRSGQLMIDGFGWAAPIESLSPSRTLEASPFAAPERVQGERADHRSDLYSAAVVAYELLAGAPAFQVIDGFSAGPQVVRNALLPARATRPELPARLEAVFQRALATRPEMRFRTAADLLAAMQAALGSPVWDRSQLSEAVAVVTAPVARSSAPASTPDPTPDPTPVAASTAKAVPTKARARDTRIEPVVTVMPMPIEPAEVIEPSRPKTTAAPVRREPVLEPYTPPTVAAEPRAPMRALHREAATAARPMKPRTQWLELALAAGCLAVVGWIASLYVGADSPFLPDKVEPAVPAVNAPAPPGSRFETAPAGKPSVSAPPVMPATATSPSMPLTPPAAAEAPTGRPPQAIELPPPSRAPAPREVAPRSPPPAPALEAAPTPANRPPVLAIAPPSANHSPNTAVSGAAAPTRPVVHAVARRAPELPVPQRPTAVRVVRTLPTGSPEQTCRQEVAVAREFCVVVRCATAEFRQHPVCVRMHAEQQRVRDLRAETMP